MKKIIFLVLISFSLNMFATDTTKISTEVNAIVDNVFDETTQAVKEISQALKFPAEHVYSVLVMQSRIIGITVTGGFLLSIIVLIISIIVFNKRHLEYDDYLEYLEYDDSLQWVFLIVSICLFIGFSIGLLAEGLPRMLNPEYGAIKEILNILQ